MKKVCLAFILTSFAFVLHAQPEDQEKQTISFIKVWGFLKYYHPNLADGKLDWDQAFMSGFRKLQTIRSKEELNAYFISLIDGLGKVSLCKTCKDTIPGGLNYNLNIDWINDISLFLPAVTEKLNFVKNNRNQKQNYYAYIKHVALVVKWSGPTFEKEKPYKDSVYPQLPMRMLTLARYWNIVNYFYPYKYLLDEDWNSVLADMVKKFYAANDTVSYHLAILEMTTKINDSHSSFYTPSLDQFFGARVPPFNIQIIGDRPVVTYPPYDSAHNDRALARGDIILQINDTPVEVVIREKLRYMQGSNDAAKRRNLTSYLLRTNADSMKFMFDRNGEQKVKTLPAYSFRVPSKRYVASAKLHTPQKPWKILDGNIGYINLGTLEPKQVHDAMKELSETKGLILDLRRYPKSVYRNLATYLNEGRTAFAKFLAPDVSFPGVMKQSRIEYTGSDHPAKYKRKVMVLINEQTQSMGEFTAMALQTGKNVSLLGSQTAGADGDTRKIPLPGGFVAYMTGLGVYYPDGRETQRIGIVPDMKVSPTIEGICANKDELLEAAKHAIMDLH